MGVGRAMGDGIEIVEQPIRVVMDIALIRSDRADVVFDKARGAANAHRRHRRDDLHVAGMGDLAGNELERSFDEAEQSAIRRTVRIVGIIAERHPRIGDEIERGAVGKADAGHRLRAGLDHVALEDGVADMERNRNAVAHHRDVADNFFDFADCFGRRRRLRLRIVSWRRRSGEQIDHVRRQLRAVRRRQCRVMLAREVARN